MGAGTVGRVACEVNLATSTGSDALHRACAGRVPYLGHNLGEGQELTIGRPSWVNLSPLLTTSNRGLSQSQRICSIRFNSPYFAAIKCDATAIERPTRARSIR